MTRFEPGDIVNVIVEGARVLCSDSHAFQVAYSPHDDEDYVVTVCTDSPGVAVTLVATTEPPPLSVVRIDRPSGVPMVFQRQSIGDPDGEWRVTDSAYPYKWPEVCEHGRPVVIYIPDTPAGGER